MPTISASSRPRDSEIGGETPTLAPASPRRLKILFVIQGGSVLRFALLLPELARRGHDVHVAFDPGLAWRRASMGRWRPPPARATRLLDELAQTYPGVTFGLGPRRSEGDGWFDLAWMTRGLADLAHNAHPHYAGARPLRHRARKAILSTLETPGEFEPASRRWFAWMGRRLVGTTDERASRRALNLARRLEEAIPPSADVDSFLLRLAPDVVVATGSFRFVSSEVDVLKSARALGIPTGIFVTSWDNLTNKGSLKFVPDRVFVWNEAQAAEAAELHAIPRDRIRATGAHAFDEWFERRPSGSREGFLTRIGLDPHEPYVVYLCSSRNIARPPSEVEFVRSWIAALRTSGDDRLRRVGVLIRPHPNASEQWEAVELPAANAVVWPRQGVHPVAAQARSDFVDTLAYSTAVVGVNTTAMIEAAILEKPVLTVRVPDFRQDDTLHFRHLLAENGGFLHVAADLDDHVHQLAGVFDEDPEGAVRRRQFVESFVRPAGLDRAAAPIGAEAIEELAEVTSARSRDTGGLALRLALGPAAALSRRYRRRRLRRRR